MRQPRWIEGSFQKKLFDIADTLENQARALSEAEAERNRIKAFLSEGDWQTIESEQAWRRRALAAEVRLAEAMKVIEPFARAGGQIPSDLPDDLWTHCSSYKYEMSEHQFNQINATGTVLASREISLTLWIDGHPLRDFRAARAFTNAAKEKT